MPKNLRKKGYKEEDDFVIQGPKVQYAAREHITNSFIQQLLKDYPYWIQNGDKFTCSLCMKNIEYVFLSTFKTDISTHMESKWHKKKVDSYNAKKDSKEKVEDDKIRKHNGVKKGDGDTLYEGRINHKNEVKRLNTDTKKTNSPSKCNFETMYKQISEGNPILEINRSFWTRKGNSQKYTCTLCNIGVLVYTNLSSFKSAVLAHVQDKYHKKRYDSLIAKESTNACSVETLATNTKCAEENKDSIEDTRSILDILLQEEEDLMGSLQEFDKDEINLNNNGLVNFNSIYNSFEKSNPVIKSSKQFIIKTENGRDFYCHLCKVSILNSLNATEFRYNLWVHLNEESHRKRLPNFSEVEKDFKIVMKSLTKALPSYYVHELKYFEIGPVFRFVKCSLCEVAVSTNLHRLENHLKDIDHKKKKHSFMRGEPLQNEPNNKRTRDAFRKLVVQLDDQVKKEVKYIQIGKIPGYVVCSLCTYVLIPTQFYVQSHLESDIHAKNKTTSPVSRNSKFKISLNDLMNTLPDDLTGYNIFEETTCGLTCKRCDTTIPPTSYDLYTHINKERHACVSE